ncbi:CopG family ribbon-helix-helix protein [Ancylobacter polymorphus]|uniref:Metal-responsive CopG/Arc/MetJ family transcriptional regulator n=1 Tax=Ancylobacter polymorphus TaxID=223390 RepID=A0ABU0BHL7_9HYPH|nr:ribbon-helix-helix domain-containing protein [Ancylobacter polymorphus]MDQ0305339.1 metal-responsive CopG/Arc/MetJ family transcriptional regulator [Ancylobacter polymorphus]
MSISVPQKKRGRPSTGVTPRVGVRLTPDVTAAVDAYAGQEGYDRSEAIRFILRDWLIGHGLLSPEPEPDEGT